MKKTLALLLIFALTFSLTACGNSRPGTSENSTPANGLTPEASSSQREEEDGVAASEGSRVLVAYYTWADNAILAEDVDAVASPSVIPPGNVQQLAGWVQEQTGADTFSIRVTEPYPSDWDACLERANQERGEDARPELAENLESLEGYDTIFLGYPNWWYGVPYGAAYLFREPRLFRKAGVPVLFPWDRRAVKKCRDHYGSNSGRGNFR